MDDARSRPPSRHDPPVKNQEIKIPRLGRRESEPHSAEISNLFEVLETNFPQDRVTWDLHHYFRYQEKEIDVQFDISFFRDLDIPYALPSYRASDFQNCVPELAVNILSKSTWAKDLSLNLDTCRILKIPCYVVYSAYRVGPFVYKPPFLRVYLLQDDGEYHLHEIREIATAEGGQTPLDPQALVDLKPHLPFQLGLMKRQILYKGNSPTYRLILVDPATGEIFQTRREQAEQRVRELEEEVKKLRGN